jgi:cysteine desulfuration protein SufE
MTINEIQESIITEMAHLDDWFERYEYLIGLGKKHPKMDANLKNENNALPGCQSKVWICVNQFNHRLQFNADSNSTITRGLLSLLLRVLNNQKPLDIAQANLYFILKTGLSRNLSPTRTNGLIMIIKHLQSLGKQYC